MSRLRDIFGLDGKDLTIHLGATVVLVVIVAGAGNEFGYDGEGVATMAAAASAALLGLRMFLGRKNRPASLAPGGEAELQELDDRLYELEQERARLLELEERVDFAERLLVSEREKRTRIEEGQ
jgi:hypothetical protein